MFASGVSLYVMPLDSTQIKLQELERGRIFSNGSALTDALTVLYHQLGVWYAAADADAVRCRGGRVCDPAGAVSDEADAAAGGGRWQHGG